LRRCEYDICIAGGGPAGIAAAIKLFQLGYQVLLIAPGNRPVRPDLQSLSPGILELTTVIGFNTSRIHRCMTPIRHTTRLWSDSIEEASHPSGFLVQRVLFDEVLLANAKQIGVRVLRASVISCHFMEGHWELKIIHEGCYKAINSKFLVDATGKKSVIHGIKKRMPARTMAVTGSWKNTSFLNAASQLEATPDCWLWGAKLINDEFQATVFTDASAVASRSELDRWYIAAIKKSKLFSLCLEGMLTGKLSAIDITPYYDEKPVDRHFIKVGESGIGFDPQSSQGVQHALASGLQGAIVVNSILSGLSDPDAAIEFFTGRQQVWMRSHRFLASGGYASSMYSNKGSFWRNRIMDGPIIPKSNSYDFSHWDPELPVRLSADVLIKPTACIEKDQIVSKPALCHPGLDESMVYWNNQEMGTLIKTLHSQVTVSELLRAWSCFMSQSSALLLFHMLRRSGVLEGAAC
jgi:hypothetical protein